jgi:predicted enzyme related to lactoylglutathione lyase
MTQTRLGRVALTVEDVDAAAADFSDLFGLDFRCFDIPAMQMRVAVGEHGIELVQSLADDAPSGYPAGLLSGVCIAVEDVERTRSRLERKGRKMIMSIPLESGRSEYVFEPVHGIPLMIYQDCGHFDPIAQ